MRFSRTRARARETRETREDGFSRTRARKPARANRACEISRAEATRQTDGRDRPTSRLAPSSRPDSQERPVPPETLGGETLVQGCAAKQYNPWLRPPKFAAPKALFGGDSCARVHPKGEDIRAAIYDLRELRFPGRPPPLMCER